MSTNLLGHLRSRARREATSGFPIEGIVAVNEDPEFQQRIQVVIPALDENVVFPKWVRPLYAFVLGLGYGAFFPPPIGSEVALFSRVLGKNDLWYASVPSEDYVVPVDFRDTAVCGIRAPGDLKFICDGDLQLRMGGGRIESDFGAIEIKAPGGIFLNGQRY